MKRGLRRDPPRVAQPRRLFLRNGLAGLASLMTEPLLVGCGSRGALLTEDPDFASTSGLPEAGASDVWAPQSSGGSGGSSGSAGMAGSGGTVGSGGTAGSGGTGSGVLRSNLAAIGRLGPADANGVRLPEGFTSRIVARTGASPVPGKPYVWHTFPDGGATYATDGGGWIYVSNSELTTGGGVGALRFDAAGTLVDAYPILLGSTTNCAGGKTAWGTWLSCEEVERGRVFECDAFGVKPARPLRALGIFCHEAAALDPVNQHIYLSEDQTDGRFYRFVPSARNAHGFADLSAGTLQVAAVGAGGKVTWHSVPDPEFIGATPTRYQVAASTVFNGGEGLAYHEGVIYLSTKGDNRVWAYDIETATIGVLYDYATAKNPILIGVDNLAVTCCGDVLVAEDGDDMQIVALLSDGTLKPLLQVEGHPGSEITGPAFDPSGSRLYFSSQRGPGNGMTFEVTGPFHLEV